MLKCVLNRIHYEILCYHNMEVTFLYNVQGNNGTLA